MFSAGRVDSCACCLSPSLPPVKWRDEHGSRLASLMNCILLHNERETAPVTKKKQPELGAHPAGRSRQKQEQLQRNPSACNAITAGGMIIVAANGILRPPAWAEYCVPMKTSTKAVIDIATVMREERNSIWPATSTGGKDQLSIKQIEKWWGKGAGGIVFRSRRDRGHPSSFPCHLHLIWFPCDLNYIKAVFDTSG